MSRSLRAHRLAASDPPTLEEAWAAVLDNPNMVYTMEVRLGVNGDEDARQDLRIAAVEAFRMWDPALAGFYRVYGWAALRGLTWGHRAMRVPSALVMAYRQWEFAVDRAVRNGSPPPEPPFMKRLKNTEGTEVIRHVSEHTSIVDIPRWEETMDADVEEARGGESDMACGHFPGTECRRERWLEGLQRVEGEVREDLLTEILYRAWGKLDIRAREVLVRHFVGDESYSEVGTALRVGRTRVGQIVLVALGEIRERMEKERKVVVSMRNRRSSRGVVELDLDGSGTA